VYRKQPNPLSIYQGNPRMNMIPAPMTQPASLHPWLPQSFDQLLVFAEHLSKSTLVPVSYQGNPSACLVAMQFGASLGINPLQSIQNIAVINGRPSLWGDAALALVRASPLCESISERREGETAICSVKRRGEPVQQRTFSKNDAMRAGLWGRKGPWSEYPARMLQMRARSFALRDVFPDVLFGITLAEEAQDIAALETQTDTGEIIEVSHEPLLPDYPQERLEANLPKWNVLIQEEKQTAQGIIAMIESKYQLSQSQKAQILALDNPSDSSTDTFEPVEN